MPTIIRGGTVVTAADTIRADILIEGERIAAVGAIPDQPGAEVIDAAGCYVFPGGVDVHTHLDMPWRHTATADDWESGTIAAACGGTTTVVDFATQERGGSLRAALDAWHARADGRSVIDYGFHLAVIDWRDDVAAELPLVVDAGVSSLKLYMAYKGVLMIDDAGLFRAMHVARDSGALTMVHAENGDVIDVLSQSYLASGQTGPLYHCLAHPPEAEAEATRRAIALAGIAGAPLYVVHLTCAGALAEVRAARDAGQAVYAETCPQYLVLDRSRYELPGFESAKYVISPPLRTPADQSALWGGLLGGDLQLVATDHCAFNYAEQKEFGRDDFTRIPNGAPGLGARLYLLYSEGVAAGRLSLNKFVDLVSARPAKLFGLYPRKGTVAPGADADLVLWDPNRAVTLTRDTLQQRKVDYTPYEGYQAHGAPRLVLRRGRVIARDGEFVGRAGGGAYLARQRPQLAE